MTKPQFILAPDGSRLAVLPETEYEALVSAATDAADAAAIREFRARLANGSEELVPASVANRILDGENPIRVWREHRGLSVRELARKLEIAAPYLSQIETGKRQGTIETLKRLSEALDVEVGDLIV